MTRGADEEDSDDEVHNPATGLTTEEAAEQLEAIGPNTIPQAQPPHLVQRVVAQLRDPMIVLLLVAGAVTTMVPSGMAG